MMKTLNGIETTYENSFNLLELLKEPFHEGDEILSLLDFCEDLISDDRLDVYPIVELLDGNKVSFSYENYDNVACNHLIIKVNNYGFDYDDKVLSYFCIKGDCTASKDTASWNEVLEIIKDWHT